MSRVFVYLLYNLLLPFVLVLGLPAFLIKGIRRGGLARNFIQRIGFLSPEIRNRLRGKKPIWIHAVSVGEIFIALKLIEALRKRLPDQLIVLSTTTTTGYRLAAEKADDRLIVIHNPVDLPWIAWTVINAIDPAIFVLVEAEIWPNLVGLLKRRGVPVLLANARLSPRSERRYQKAKPIIAPIFSLLDGVTVPYPEDAVRWSSLGIDPDKIAITGSIKFDQSAGTAPSSDLLSTWLAETGMPETRRILLGGSTHDGEEVLLAKTVRDLQTDFPDLQLVLVPRHAERGSEIATQLGEAGFDPVLKVQPNPLESSTQEGLMRVWIANTTGELRAWFTLADLVVIGKSFTAIGGQNPVEPILAGRPIVVGPHMENFAEVMSELLKVEGLRQVADESALPGALREFLHDPASGRDMADRGAAAMARHEGSAVRNAEWVVGQMKG